ncbi:MAG: hypothetical protein Q7U05_03860 [Polaromonas sp.]|nr:hypothetical protein [Polaromonas sp.]
MTTEQQILAATMQILRYAEMAEARAARGQKMRDEIDSLDKRLTNFMQKMREVLPNT